MSEPCGASDPLAQLSELGWTRLNDGAWRLVNSDGTFVALADPPAVVRLPPPGFSISSGDMPVNTFDSHERLLEAAQDSLVDFARRVMLYGTTAMAAAATAAWTDDPAGMQDWAEVVLGVALDPRLENKDAAKARADYKAVARLLGWRRCKLCWWRHQPGECVTQLHALGREPGWLRIGSTWQLGNTEQSLRVLVAEDGDSPPRLIVMPPASQSSTRAMAWEPFTVAEPLSNDARLDVRFLPVGDSSRMWCVECGCSRPQGSDEMTPCSTCGSDVTNQDFDPALLAVCAYAHDVTSLVAVVLDYSRYLRAIIDPNYDPYGSASSDAPR